MDSFPHFSELQKVKYTPSARGIIYFGIVFLIPPLAVYFLALVKVLFNPPFTKILLGYLARLPIIVQLLILLVFPVVAFVIGVIARIKKEHPKTSNAVIIIAGLLILLILIAALRSS